MREPGSRTAPDACRGPASPAAALRAARLGARRARTVRSAGRRTNDLVDHVRLLIAWNGSINLTAIRDPEAIVREHVLDSLTAVGVLREHGSRCPARPGQRRWLSGTAPGPGPAGPASPARRERRQEGGIPVGGSRDLEQRNVDQPHRRRSGHRRLCRAGRVAGRRSSPPRTLAGRCRPGDRAAGRAGRAGPARWWSGAASSWPGSGVRSTPSWPSPEPAIDRLGGGPASVVPVSLVRPRGPRPGRHRQGPAEPAGLSARSGPAPAAAHRAGRPATLGLMRVAVLSDIHANLRALDAILARIGLGRRDLAPRRRGRLRTRSGRCRRPAARARRQRRPGQPRPGRDRRRRDQGLQRRRPGSHGVDPSDDRTGDPRVAGRPAGPAHDRRLQPGPRQPARPDLGVHRHRLDRRWPTWRSCPPTGGCSATPTCPGRTSPRVPGPSPRSSPRPATGDRPGGPARPGQSRQRRPASRRRSRCERPGPRYRGGRGQLGPSSLRRRGHPAAMRAAGLPARGIERIAPGILKIGKGEW